MRIITHSLLAYCILFAADPLASSKGSNIGNTALTVFGSKDGVNNRLAQPLMSNTKMTTVDGTKTFDAQIQCPASSKSVAVMFIPSGGNDYRLMIQQDTDLNGAFDYAYDTSLLGRTVSGVCTNGVLMCNPSGSWTDCKSYVWDTSDKKIFLRNVINNSHEMGACYCSNSSCGVSSLAPQIYENIGGGISAAIMHKNPLFLQSKSEWSFAEMTYYLYGQDKTNCTGLGTSNWDKYGEKNPTIYYDAQMPPNTSIADVAIDQGSDPTSYYSMISHQNEVSYNNAGDTIGIPSKAQCTITNLPKATLEIEELQKNISGFSVCVDDGMFLSITANNTGQASFYLSDYWGGTSSPNCGGGKKTLDSEDLSLKIGVSEGNYYSVEYFASLSQVGGQCSKKTATTTFLQNKNTSINSTTFIMPSLCTASGPQTAVIDANIQMNIQTEKILSVQSNGCNSQENDSSCRIESEQICDQSGANCVYSVRNGISTGFTPIKMCYALNTSVASYSICTDGNTMTKTLSGGGNAILASEAGMWFTKKRVYTCDNKNINLDPSKMTRAAGTAYKTEQSATTMTYTDHTGTTVSVNNLPSGDECPAPVCTVKRASKSADQFSDNTNRSQTVTGDTVTETVVKTCTKSGTSMTCPTESGETMIEGCSCSGNWTGFQQAVTTLGAVSEAAKDMICSQN